MSGTPLQVVMSKVQELFLDRADMTISKVSSLAISVLQQIHPVQGLSDEEKKALVLLSLQKGLAAAGVLVDAENHIVHASVEAAFAALKSVPRAFCREQGFLSSVGQFLSKCLPLCSQEAQSLALDPKDSVLIEEAKAALAKFAPSLQVRTLEPTQEYVASVIVVSPAPPVPAAPVPVDPVTLVLPALPATPVLSPATPAPEVPAAPAVPADPPAVPAVPAVPEVPAVPADPAVPEVPAVPADPPAPNRPVTRSATRAARA